MSPTITQRPSDLRRCRGFLVLASDGPLGQVESPLFPSGRDEPDFLILRTRRLLRLRRPVVAAALVEHVDPERGLVYLRARGEQVARMPEHVPLAL